MLVILENSIFVATWNVAGRSPPEDLNLDEWLHSSAPADIYVLGCVSILHLLFKNVSFCSYLSCVFF